MDPAQAPWSSLVRVQAPGLARCTGFAVAGGRVVTAAHCLYSARLGGFIPASALHVLAGYGAGDFTAHARVASYRIAPGYDPKGAQGATQAGADVAVLTLAGPASIPPLPLATAAPGQALTLGGYNQDRAEVIAADTACRLTALARDVGGRALLAHDCAGTRGTSGAPLLALRDGGWSAVGVQVAARKDGPGGVAAPASVAEALLD